MRIILLTDCIAARWTNLLCSDILYFHKSKHCDFCRPKFSVVYIHFSKCSRRYACEMSACFCPRKLRWPFQYIDLAYLRSKYEFVVDRFWHFYKRFAVVQITESDKIATYFTGRSGHWRNWQVRLYAMNNDVNPSDRFSNLFVRNNSFHTGGIIHLESCVLCAKGVHKTAHAGVRQILVESSE